jgi:hypothetical protein
MPEPLATEIIAALCAVKAYDLPDVCVGFGLAAGTSQAAFQSKRRYVEERVNGMSQSDLAALGEKVVSRYRTYGLEEAMEVVKPSVPYRIDEITRRAIIRELEQLGNLSGHLGVVDFLSRVWPLPEMRRPDAESFGGTVTVADAIDRHMVRNDDWTTSDLFEELGARGVSDRRFGKCLEMVVAPLVRDEPDQQRYAEKINGHLARAGYALRPVEEQSGYPVYRLVALVGGVAGKAKNLIFAANGPKPELVLIDAVSNDIKIVRNEEFCLVFDDPIPSRGLLWTDLVAWWARKNGLNPAVREAVQLPQTTRGQFARQAAALRWDADQPVMKLLGPEKVLTPVRYGDAATDLWTTLNVVQEHLIRGGDRYMGYTAGMGIRRNRTRGVAGIGEGQKLNNALWTLASEFANN